MILGAPIVFTLLTFKMRRLTTSKKADHIIEVVDIPPTTPIWGCGLI